jgi:hypothetical protein
MNWSVVQWYDSPVGRPPLDDFFQRSKFYEITLRQEDLTAAATNDFAQRAGALACGATPR